MKKSCANLAVLFLFTFYLVVSSFSSLALAGGDPVKVAVLPFSINSVSDMSFLQTGIQDMLSSRLYWKGKVQVLDRETVNSALSSAKGFTGQSLALLIGGKLGANFVVYGSLTMIGESTSIDAKIVDVEGAKEPLMLFKQTQSLNQVIPQINAFATDINTKMFKRPMAFDGFQGQAPSVGSSAPVQGNYNPHFISHNSAVSVNTPGTTGQGVWTSPAFNNAILGMDTGDVNNDGIEEILWISAHKLHVFQYRNGSLVPVPLAGAGINRINSYVGVDVADINQNGTPEIFLTGLTASEDKVASLVLEFDGSRFRTMVKNSPWMYRVSKSGKGKPVLLGQKAGDKKGQGIFSRPVYRMEAQGNRYVPRAAILMGKRANVLGVALGEQDAQGNGVVLAFDRNDYIRIYNNPRSSSWKSVEKLGGNMSRFQIPSTDMSDKTPQTQYFPMRIRTFDSAAGKGAAMNILAAGNHDITGSILGGFRSFNQTRIKALIQDSLGLRPAWETRVLNGRISDFFVADIDGDNVQELVVALVKKDRGQLIATRGQSVLLAYDLK